MKLGPTVEEEEGSATFEEVVHVDLDEGSTLVGEESAEFLQGVKKVDVEVTDDDSEDGDVGGSGDECGVKRKRTIRLIIRSRAFL
ncbi:hypothetical protein ACN47E_004522 [Coniothyrium glycines]